MLVNNFTKFNTLEKFSNNMYIQSSLLQLTFIICLSLFPVILLTTLSEAVSLFLSKRTSKYKQNRKKYAKWIFLKLIGKLNILSIQGTKIKNKFNKLKEVQEEILNFRDEAIIFLTSTILDYSPDNSKWFGIDEKESLKLDLRRLVLIFFFY